MNPLFLIDFYKVGHVSQYPPDTTQVWSNWTPRSARVPVPDGVVFFGLQYFIKEILQKEWGVFFRTPIDGVLNQYRELIRATLGVENPKTDHIESLHKHGYLPLNIWALPEGTVTPIKIPQLVITNTTPDTFWLPNYLETILSNILWKGCTSATTARRYRKIFEKYAKMTGETDFSFIEWMGHDFSFRGMSGREDAILSGMGHLTQFSGTDTVPAIVAAREFYGADLSCGGSVPATEHSVMCAGEKENEQETFRRLIQDIYPNGVVSVVSDTWDLWKVLTEYVPNLKETILNRGNAGPIPAKLVIRPDSGNPADILCGLSGAQTPAIAKGVLSLLAEALGTSKDTGFRFINKAGAIYGDSITPERAEEIMYRMLQKGFHPYNVVLGIGSYTYEYVTRDTYGFAMKATAVRRGGKVIDIFKKPVTDSGDKNSLRGIPVVWKNEKGLYVSDGQMPYALDHCEFQKVFSNGNLLIEQSFSDIRKRARA